MFLLTICFKITNTLMYVFLYEVLKTEEVAKSILL